MAQRGGTVAARGPFVFGDALDGAADRAAMGRARAAQNSCTAATIAALVRVRRSGVAKSSSS